MDVKDIFSRLKTFSANMARDKIYGSFYKAKGVLQ